MLGEVFGPGGTARRLEVARGGHGDEAHLAQPMGDQRRVGERPHPDRDVDPLRLKIGHRVAEAHLHPKLRVGLDEARPPRQEGATEPEGQPHPEAAGGSGVKRAHRGCGPLHQGHRFPAAVEKGPAFRGEGDGARGPLEQPNPQSPFESSHRAAHRGGGHAELSGGLSKAPPLRGEHEGDEVAERILRPIIAHEAILPFPNAY
ncbi:MAG: hypothetical protein AAFU79_04540 [Myxococcota bacterium]